MVAAKSQQRGEIRSVAIEALQTHGNKDHPDVAAQDEALAGNLDDTLSDDFILAELRAIKQQAAPVVS